MAGYLAAGAVQLHALIRATTMAEARAALATAAGHWALIAAAVTGAGALALACIGGRRKSSERAEPRGGAPVPGAGETLDHG